MKRRDVIGAVCAASSAGLMPFARAHHGWSGFDQDRPIYLEGRVLKSLWQNPHVARNIESPATLKLPADLAQRALPAQSARVDGKALLAKAVLPTRQDRRCCAPNTCLSTARRMA